jgi:DNA polymerase-3 subunit alpha
VFTVEAGDDGEKAIRYALGAIKGVGAAAMASLVNERHEHGPFKDLFDFALRCEAKVVNKRQLESLAAAGAFDRLNSNRAQVFANVELLTQRASAAANERASGQASLFGGEAAAVDTGRGLTEVAPWSVMERLNHEFQAIGFYLSAHPLDAYGSRLERLKVVPSVRLLAHTARGAEATRVKLAGTVISKKERTSARGNRFAFVQMSDATGMFEVTVFSEVLGRARDILEAGSNVLATCEARREGEGLRLTVQELVSLDEAVAHAAPGLKVAVEAESALEKLREIIKAAPRGKGEVSLVLSLGGGTEVEIGLPGRFAVPAVAVMELRALPGVTDVREI